MELEYSDSEEEDETSKILWIDEFTYTRQPLAESLRRHPSVLTFLKVSGAIWPDDSCDIFEKIVRFMWNALTRFLIIAAAALIATNFAIYLSDSVTVVGFDLSSWSLDLVFVTQATALLCSLVAIRRRLASISSALELSYFEDSVKYCVVYFAASFFPSILYPIYHILLLATDERSSSAVQVAAFAILPFSELAIAGFLAVHMLFILVDARTLAANFTQLAESVREGSMTSRRSKSILREIHHRVGNSLCEVSPIILTAALEIAVLSYMVHKDFLAHDFVPMLLLTFLFLKEIQFLILVVAVLAYCGVRRWQVSSKKFH